MQLFIQRLVLPLVIRQTVNITNAGSNFTETTDLSTFGFLYGTFPAAPGVFVVATRYNVDIDLVSWEFIRLKLLFGAVGRDCINLTRKKIMKSTKLD